MKITADRQPAQSGDWFEVDGARIRVNRVSRNPTAPWVDIDVITPNGAMWSKRMPTGIPATWQRVGGAA